MGKHTIAAAVTNRVLQVIDDGCVVAGNVAADYLHMTLDGEWDGLTVYVTFKGCAGSPTTVDYSDSIEIPWEQTAAPCRLYIGVQGYDAGGNLVVNTQRMQRPISVKPSGEAGGAAPEQPSASTLQRVEACLETMEGIADTAQGAIDGANEAARRCNEAAAPTVRVGSVTTAESGQAASVTNSGTEKDAVLDFVFPASAEGSKGEKGDPGEPGADGASVTVQSVSESAEDGGSNVVTFSDGTSLTVRNGSKGSKGDDGSPGEAGADGYSPTVTVSQSNATATITVTDKDGTKTTELAVLPQATADDAGKLLRVQADGTWAAEAVPSATGVSF